MKLFVKFCFLISFCNSVLNAQFNERSGDITKLYQDITLNLKNIENLSNLELHSNPERAILDRFKSKVPKEETKNNVS